MHTITENPDAIPFDQLPEWAKEPRQNPDDQAPVVLLLLRDCGISAGLMASWWWMESQLAGQANGLLSLASGLWAAFCGFFVLRLVHEWGHLLPARAMGTLSPVKGFRSVTWLFDYDFLGATKPAFFVSSIGASVLHWLLFAYWFVTIPGDTAGEKGLLLGSLFFAVIGSAVEVPMMWRSLMGLRPYNIWEIHWANGDRNKRLSALLAAIVTGTFYFVYF